MAGKVVLRYHIVLVTRYRKPVLGGIADDVYAAMDYVAGRSSFKILSMGIEDGNHIHLVVRMSAQYSVAAMVNRIKAMTLKYLWDRQEEYLSHYYRGDKKKLWSGGYWASTIGDVSLEKVLKYVKKQQFDQIIMDGKWVTHR